MAKFRMNHSRPGAKQSGGMIVRVGLFTAIIGGLFIAFNRFAGSDSGAVDPNGRRERAYALPQSSTNRIVQHDHYSLSYSETHRQAEWVAYLLSREQLEQPFVERPNDYDPDPVLGQACARSEDYRHSGYDRGHLAPAADMAFDTSAIRQTFYMSNISPQSRNFNQGIWRELEELTRDWAKKYKKLYVVSGPVLTKKGKGRIGESGVTIPAAFFKVLLDLEDPERKGIGFILPNEISYEPLYQYAVSIDSVEAYTQLDFFPELMTDNLEAELEGSVNIDLWYFSKSKHDTRVNRWNRDE